MRTNQLFLSVVVAVASLNSALAASSMIGASPVGYWKTMDNVTGKPKSIIQVWKTSNQLLMGKVIKVFAKNDKNLLCTACVGAQHNQPITGMVVISGLKLANNQWKSGEIFNPENGKTYRCSARLSENGKKLNVKGYFGFSGFPIFGHSQTWERVDLMSG